MQEHQEGDLLLRRRPVFGGEGVEAQVLQPQVGGRLHHPLGGLEPLLVARVRGRPRPGAHRPFPSMMMPDMGRKPGGRSPEGSIGSGIRLPGFPSLFRPAAVDVLDVLVRELLDLVHAPLGVVLGDLGVLLHLLQLLVGVPPHVADGDPALLGHVLGHLDQLLAPLLGERRDVDADDLAVVARVHRELGLLDGLLDLGQHRAVPGLDDHQAGLGDGDRGHLVEGRLLP